GETPRMAPVALADAARPESGHGGDAYADSFRERMSEFAARAFISGLFVVLATRIGAEFLQTGHLTGLLLLVSELLVVVLTVVRRRAAVVDRTWQARVVAAASIVLVPLIKPTGGGLVADAWTAALSGVGLLVIIAGKVTLGRSFGLMPAHRGLVSGGIYGFVRHPIYLGYLVTHIAFVVAHPSPWNLTLLFISDASLLLRAVYEERTLARDPEYVSYMERVRWRVAPGVF
ncbi:MAG TPA: methyltransferase, partial [Gemmatimonadaceae bacterium]|nr:methyltransferase [Gemmatimonadaceae bacterium]